MIDYYTMESVRKQIIGKYDVRESVSDYVPLSTWNRYPCSIKDACKRKKQIKCVGYVSIFVNTEKVK